LKGQHLGILCLVEVRLAAVPARSRTDKLGARGAAWLPWARASAADALSKTYALQRNADQCLEEKARSRCTVAVGAKARSIPPGTAPTPQTSVTLLADLKALTSAAGHASPITFHIISDIDHRAVYRDSSDKIERSALSPQRRRRLERAGQHVPVHIARTSTER
jgi:hypothetical protein